MCVSEEIILSTFAVLNCFTVISQEFFKFSFCKQRDLLILYQRINFCLHQYFTIRILRCHFKINEDEIRMLFQHKSPFYLIIISIGRKHVVA